MRPAHRIGRFKGDEPKRTCDEIYDRSRRRDATTGERTDRFLTAIEVHRRENVGFPAEGYAGSAMPNGLVRDVRNGVGDERNRRDRQEVWEGAVIFLGSHSAHDAPPHWSRPV